MAAPVRCIRTRSRAFCVGRFDSVAVEATSYRLPFKGTITEWNRRLRAKPHSVLKGPLTVAYLKKLRDCDEVLGAFPTRCVGLRTLRVIVWQLPPSHHKDLERLDRSLAGSPQSVLHAVKFRTRAGEMIKPPNRR